MKTYITYDNDFHEIICIHQMPNIDCPICKPIKELKNRNNQNNLVEICKDVQELQVKTYDSPTDSPAVLEYYDDKNNVNELEHKENNAEDKLFFLCSCYSFEHQAIFWNNEEWGLYIEMHLTTDRNFFYRLWYGLKYAFGYKSRFGAWDEFIFDDKDKIKLRDYLNLNIK